MYIYSAYWGCWSRSLGYVQAGSEQYPSYVEVNLTPIGGENVRSDASWQEQVQGIKIRKHVTALGHGDLVVDTLPPIVETQILARVGEELYNRLLNEDFLSQIDWSLWEKRQNGGCNLADCIHPVNSGH